MKVIVNVPAQTITVDGVTASIEGGIARPTEHAQASIIAFDSAVPLGHVDRGGNHETFRDPAVVGVYVELWRKELARAANASIGAEASARAAHAAWQESEKKRIAEFEAANAKLTASAKTAQEHAAGSVRIG